MSEHWEKRLNHMAGSEKCPKAISEDLIHCFRELDRLRAEMEKAEAKGFKKGLLLAIKNAQESLYGDHITEQSDVAAHYNDALNDLIDKLRKEVGDE